MKQTGRQENDFTAHDGHLAAPPSHVLADVYHRRHAIQGALAVPGEHAARRVVVLGAGLAADGPAHRQRHLV